MTEFLIEEGEAICPECGGDVYRMMPTTRVESLWFEGDKKAPEYDVEDYDDEPNHATFECGDCNVTLTMPGAEGAGE